MVSGFPIGFDLGFGFFSKSRRGASGGGSLPSWSDLPVVPSADNVIDIDDETSVTYDWKVLQIDTPANVVVRIMDSAVETMRFRVELLDPLGTITIVAYGIETAISLPAGKIAVIAGTAGDVMTAIPAGGRVWAVTGDLQWA